MSDIVTIKVYDDGSKVRTKLTALKFKFTESNGRNRFHYIQFNVERPTYSRSKHAIAQRQELERMQDPLYKW